MVAGLTFAETPVRAGSTSLTDGDGVDYDAACRGMPTATASNSYASPGGTGCTPDSGYDGSTEATDLRSISLESNANGQIVAACTVDGTIPPAGSTSRAALDGPYGIFTGVGCKVMFQNKDVQTYVPTNPTGGCVHTFSGIPVYDVHGSWKDGYHFFVGFKVTWDGARWVYSVQQGEFDPAHKGGFIYEELGSNSGGGTWITTNSNHPYGTDWSVAVTGSGPTTVTLTVPGVLETTDTINCVGGVFKNVYATPGDHIANVKGLTSANISADMISTTMYFSDFTGGNSTTGVINANIPGIAYTPGRDRQAIGWDWPNTLANVEHLEATGARYGFLSNPDTYGPGPTCPTPTLGGTLPPNPLFTPDTACHNDDDAFGRGSLLAEFWDTTHGFTF